MKRIFASFLLLATVMGHSQNKSGLKLWYKQPAGQTWENALPIGNGKLGAMIYGNVEKETIQLNEHTVWSALKETWEYDSDAGRKDIYLLAQ